MNGHYFKCCIAESFVKVSILPYVGSVCYLSRQICFGSPDFSGADALIAAVGRTVSCRGNHNAAAATPVLYTVGLYSSEKATNFCEISTVDLSYVVMVKSTVEILSKICCSLRI